MNLIQAIEQRAAEREQGISDALLALELNLLREIARKMPQGAQLSEANLMMIGTWSRGMARLHGLKEAEQVTLVTRILNTLCEVTK